jgi:tRNA uridine 5-carboxymethylaminomethyl modification enzyme
VVARFEAASSATPKKKMTAADLLSRPEISWAVLGDLMPGTPELSDEVAEQVTTDIRYAGYLRRAEQRAARTQKMSAVALAPDMDFRLPGISHEVAERLIAARPETLGAASRLPGVTPAAIDVLAVHIARRRSA